MKYLHTLYDQALEREYKLYLMNARELSERLKKDYNLPSTMIHLFNSESRLEEYLTDIKKLKRSGHVIKEDDLRLTRVRESIKNIKNNSHLQPMTKKGIEFGYELMPIALSAKGDVENPETSIELLDGFKRMFVMDVVPEIDVLVKVYGEIDDREWINAMIVYNSWKFIDGGGSNKYMDRGFQLGLYYRYRLLFVNMPLTQWDMFRALDIYTTGGDLRSYHLDKGSTTGTYKTFWNNSVFYDDIQAVYDILTIRPSYEIKKKGIVETIDTGKNKRLNTGLMRILEVLVSLLGEIRRYEFENGIDERKAFDRTILSSYLNEPVFHKHMVKVIQMSVDGHVINHIKLHMREDMKKYMYEGMGYVIERKEHATPAPQKIILT